MAAMHRNILVVDVGGTKVKVLATGQKKPVKIPSGSKMTAREMVKRVRRAAAGWKYFAVSIGYPGPVVQGKPIREPHNLGRGWVGFDFKKAFGCPVKVINDAAMQALGSYQGGRMLFLGFGTGLGSAMIAENVIVPLELGQLPHRKGLTLGDVLGRGGLQRLGRRPWARTIRRLIPSLMSAFAADY